MLFSQNIKIGLVPTYTKKVCDWFRSPNANKTLTLTPVSYSASYDWLLLARLKPGSHERHKHKHKINTKTKHDFFSGTCEDKTTRIFLCFAFCSALGLCLCLCLCLCLWRFLCRRLNFIPLFWPYAYATVWTRFKALPQRHILRLQIYACANVWQRCCPSLFPSTLALSLYLTSRKVRDELQPSLKVRLHTAINRVDFVQYLGACYILYVQR